MTVEELIARLSQFSLKMPVLIKSLELAIPKLTLFEDIAEIKKEGLFANCAFTEAVVLTPTFDNREDPTKS